MYKLEHYCRMNGRSLYFVEPGAVECRTRELPPLSPSSVLVETETSAISAGTEGLVCRGEAPETLDTDGPVKTLIEDLSFPLRYGYAAVGSVVETGADVDDSWLGERVFAYNPHESRFVTAPEDLLMVPSAVPRQHAPLLANAETAVNFLLDGQPVIGERVAVFGQGVVGLLTTGLLASHPLECLVAVDPVARRRELALEFGADVVLDPETDDIESLFEEHAPGKPDLTLELSGNPDALDDAMSVTGYDGRIVVGSWYGTKPAQLEFGGRFHRHRIHIRSSQVSTIAPRHEGRWSRERRHDQAWQWLQRLPVDSLITHQIPLSKAQQAYQLLEDAPGSAVQVLLTYDE